jgi:RHS repeat-associated protein
VTLLLFAPLLIVAVIHRKRGRRWSEPAATVLLAVTVVVIGMALSGGNAAPAVAVPAPMPFLSPPPPPPGCTLPTAPITGTRVISYTYDPLGRLSQAAQSDGACYQYKYDQVGNRTALTTTAGVTTYGYDAANRLTSVGGQTYTWDNAGRLTNNGRFTYTYNTAGLLRMTQAQGITATQVYTYNGDGLLMARNTAKYVYDQAADLPQMLSDGRVLYVPGVGQWDGKAWTYELPDGLGSVRQLADAQGYLVQRYEYGPFGEMLVSEGQRTNSLRYTGEQWDSDVGLLYLRARWYDPATGRFTTRDPFPGLAALPQTQHPYVYGLNNPINLTDHSGEIVPILIAVGIGAAIGGVGGAISYALTHPCEDYLHSGGFWRAVGVGAFSGTMAGLVGWAVPVIIPAGASIWGAVGVGALSGALAAGVGQTTTNLAMGNAPLAGLPEAMFVGSVTGGIAGGVGWKLGQIDRDILWRVLRPVNIKNGVIAEGAFAPSRGGISVLRGPEWLVKLLAPSQFEEIGGFAQLSRAAIIGKGINVVPEPDPGLGRLLGQLHENVLKEGSGLSNRLFDEALRSLAQLR